MTPKKINNLILYTVGTRVVYVVLIFAIYLFLAGHNAPGGGFIAGLMTAAAIVLLYIALGSVFIRRTLHYDFKYLIAMGLLCAFSCGVGGMLVGRPFLTHTFGAVTLPLLGQIEFATATIFDFGVYLVVVGGLVTIITAIGESDFPRTAPDENR